MNSDIFELDHEITLLPWLGRTMKHLDYFFSDVLSAGGIELTKVQWLMLKLLYKEDGQPQNKLAFLTNRDKASLTRLIGTMERKNLVARIPSKVDHRINHVYITKHGKNILIDSIPVIKYLIETIHQNISKEEIDTVIRVMKIITNNINNAKLVAVKTK